MKHLLTTLLLSCALSVLAVVPTGLGFSNVATVASASTGTPPPPGGDPYFASRVLMMHFDGTDGSSTYTDNSGSGHSVTGSGNAQLDTAQSKYGSASLLLDGTGDYITVPASAVFDFGTAAFSIETWARFNSVSGIQYLFDIGSNGTFVRITSGNILLIYATGAQVISAVISTISTNTWYHLALVRSGSSWTFYIDGTAAATGTDARAAGSAASAVRIGEYGGGTGFAFNGWLDDFRVSTRAEYTSGFTPPAAAHPDS